MNKELIEKIIAYNYNEYGAEYGDALVDLKHENEWLHHIIKEVRESAKRELKIAEENIKQSEKWLDIEEEKEHAKRDIHTGKVVKRYMEMFLEILDKENK